ncbi:MULTISPECIES: class I SAM-dependent DNA methyltransferase [unclassified Lysinibacillus]|uniref:class I SAM-dependent DNA methyltransferase n=1 Tax=unclassified Lysinibacillus TaxID=2636778 RepID=UPI0038170D1B
MEYSGAAAYDDATFFKDYLTRRNRIESPNNSIEKPIILELMSDINGKKVLDLGCGDAQFGVELLQKGCIHYDGVEGSENMVREASKNLQTTTGHVYYSAMEEWNFPTETYDIVISRLALHYLADLQGIFSAIYNTLVSNGKFIFSVQHPILTSSCKSAVPSAAKTDWIVDDYFNSGKRVEPWINKNIVKYHRTVEEYFQLLKHAGFTMRDMREGMPTIENFSSESEFQRRMRIPLFLMFSCEKEQRRR